MDSRSQSFQLYKNQNRFISTKDKFPAMVAGYGSGKTYAFCLKALAELGRNPAKTILLAEPVYPMVRDVLQPTLEEILREIKFDYTYKASEMKYVIRWKSGHGTLILRSAENWRRWAGLNLAGFGIDEACLLKDDGAWKMGISRLRDGHHLTGWTTSTPEGFNWHYRYWAEEQKKDYKLIQAKTTDNKHLPQGYIDSLYENYDERLIKAYINGEYVNLQYGSTYYSFDRQSNTGEVRYDPKKEIKIAMDFNVDPFCAILLQEYDIKPQIRVFDEVKIRHSGGDDLMTTRMAKHIKAKYPQCRQFTVYPDPAGQARKTSSKFTDHDLLRQEGFKVRYTKQAPSVTDSVNSVNNAMKTILIDSKCKNFILDLEQVVNKEGTREIDKSNKELTHFSDAFRYFCHYEHPCRKPKTKTFLG